MFPAPARRITLTAATASPSERRSHRRYPVQFNLQYKLSRNQTETRQGVGRTRDFSRGGLYFDADQYLPKGHNVELFVDWPVLLDGVCPLKLVVVGRIVRSSGLGHAVRIARCEFRTRGARAVPLNEAIVRSGIVKRHPVAARAAC